MTQVQLVAYLHVNRILPIESNVPDPLFHHHQLNYSVGAYHLRTRILLWPPIEAQQSFCEGDLNP